MTLATTKSCTGKHNGTQNEVAVKRNITSSSVQTNTLKCLLTCAAVIAALFAYHPPLSAWNSKFLHLVSLVLGQVRKSGAGGASSKPIEGRRLLGQDRDLDREEVGKRG